MSQDGVRADYVHPSSLALHWDRPKPLSRITALVASHLSKRFHLEGCGTLLRRLRHTVLVLTSGGTQRAKSETLAHSLVDLCAVAPFVWRESHHRLVYLGGNGQRAVGRLSGPCPRDRKRLCCRWPRGLDPRRSSHFAPRFLICLKIRIAGSPSRTIFARLRSLAGNIIALTTAERSFIVP
jgi:hypothetical protein